MSEEKRSIYSPSDSPPSRLSSTTLALGAAIYMALFALLSWIVHLVGLQELQLLVAGAGVWGPLFYVGIKAMTFTFAPLSAGPIQLAAGLLFGIELGTFYSLLGEVIGGTINVLIGRLFGRPLILRLVGAQGVERIDSFYHRYLDDWKQLLAARLALFSVYDFISYAVGLGRIRLLVYILVSFFGGWLPTYVFVRFGAEAAQDIRVQLGIYAVAAISIIAFILFRRPVEHLLERLRK
ncbi:MAG: VTT domain-containing protein [Chloroflexi bacterium]|nr:VTT domain-containing protein [Chloroflexota bacterium]MCY4248599.1 VTT domain-containing protein [Chloroflexota bacterium]